MGIGAEQVGREEAGYTTTRLRTKSPALWNIVIALHRQWRALQITLVVILAFVLVVLGVLVAVRVQTGIAIAEFTRDPLAYTGLPVYRGALSNIGAMIWAGAAAICFFTYGIVRARTLGRERTHFLLAAGAITTVLLADDLFMLHETVLPEHFGIPEELAYAAYAVLLSGFLVWFRSTILQTDFLLLVLAFAGFGISVGIDLTAMLYSLPGLYLFEDGSKFFGIVCWSAYFARVSAQSIMRSNSVFGRGRFTRAISACNMCIVI